jgi:hypothetical protein
VPGCRLSLLGAWQADGPGVYVITERGIYLVSPELKKPRRLVPAGEAPLDPFPFVVSQGVSPAGKALAYLDLTFRGGELQRLDVKAVDESGRRLGAVTDIWPVAMGWSGDGHRLVAAQRGRRGGVLLHALDIAEHKHLTVASGLRVTNTEFPVRLFASRDGRYVALNGPFEDGALLSVALVDLQTKQVKLIKGCANHLVCGWRADGWLLVSDLGSVAALSPDGEQRQPVYQPAGETVEATATRRLAALRLWGLHAASQWRAASQTVRRAGLR